MLEQILKLNIPVMIGFIILILEDLKNLSLTIGIYVFFKDKIKKYNVCISEQIHYHNIGEN